MQSGGAYTEVQQIEAPGRPQGIWLAQYCGCPGLKATASLLMNILGLPGASVQREPEQMAQGQGDEAGSSGTAEATSPHGATEESPSETCPLPELLARRERKRPASMLELCSSPPAVSAECSPDKPCDRPQTTRADGGGSDSRCLGSARRPRSLALNLATPSSCSSLSYRLAMSPATPEALRSELKLLTGHASAVLFDFDGTLTASPGETAQRCRKQVELRERAPMLRPRLGRLREAGLLLGIISKSSEFTICGALQEAGLAELFHGPLVAKAVGFEGKAGFILDMVRKGDLGPLGDEGQSQVLLVDDDILELERAKERGIQTYAAPKEGGLQEEDFEEIFAGLGLHSQARRPAAEAADSGSGGLAAVATPSPVTPKTTLLASHSPGLPLLPELPVLPVSSQQQQLPAPSSTPAVATEVTPGC